MGYPKFGKPLMLDVNIYFLRISDGVFPKFGKFLK